MAKKTHSTDDKILDLYYNAQDYFAKNKKRVYTILGIAAVVIAIVFIYFMRKGEQSENAMIEFTKASEIYTTGNYQAAINGDSLGYSKGLLFIVNEYGSTQSGENAKIMLANSYYNLGDFGNAERYFKDYSGDDPILKAASIAGVAAVKGAMGNFIEAAKEYENAANVSELVALNDEYLFDAAKNYSMAKDAENYARVSTELKQEYPQSSYIMQLQRYELN
jgi:tetratricopeptide (TPR) repeat protein